MATIFCIKYSKEKRAKEGEILTKIFMIVYFLFLIDRKEKVELSINTHAWPPAPALHTPSIKAQVLGDTKVLSVKQMLQAVMMKC